MGAVVGVDLSSKALDLVKLDEDSNRAEWVRCELAGSNAWERTLAVREAMPGHVTRPPDFRPGSWWDDVYLVAIEAPYGRGQAGTNAILNRVVGAVAASLPARLRSPERCWVVRPDEWKTGLGLKGKPTWADIDALTGSPFGWDKGPELREMYDEQWNVRQDVVQNARDAYCLAMFCRDTNAQAVTAALEAHP